MSLRLVPSALGREGEGMSASHKRWLDGLSLRERLIYDRAFGAAWSKKESDRACRDAGTGAVRKAKSESELHKSA